MNPIVKDIVASAVEGAAEALAPHVERMVAEHADLVDKAVALDKVLTGKVDIPDLSASDKALMTAQLAGMAAYASALMHRILSAIK